MQAPKNGFFYVLDRATGELLSAEKYVQVTWASRSTSPPAGPIETRRRSYEDAPKMVFPAPSGGHNWHPMAWSPKTGLVYIPAREMALTYPMKAGFKHDDRVWNTGLDFAAYLQIIGKAPEPAPVGKLIAWDPAQGKAAWTVEQKGAFNGGILATAGNLVFQGRPDGVLVAYAADTGKVLWETETSIGIIAPPVDLQDRRRSVRRGARRLGRQHHRRDGRRGRDRYHPREHGPDDGVEAGRSGHHAAGAAEEPRHPRAAAAHRVGRGDRLTAARSSTRSAASATACSRCRAAWSAICGSRPPRRTRVGTRSCAAAACATNGMASFRDLLSSEDAEAIRAYVISRAIEDRAVKATTDSGMP